MTELTELIGWLLEGIALAAIDGANMVFVQFDQPARYIAREPGSGITVGLFVGAGEPVRVNREWRLIVEPIYHVKLRPLCRVNREWMVC